MTSVRSDRQRPSAGWTAAVMYQAGLSPVLQEERPKESRAVGPCVGIRHDIDGEDWVLKSRIYYGPLSERLKNHVGSTLSPGRPRPPSDATVLAADVRSTLIMGALLYTPLMLIRDHDQQTT